MSLGELGERSSSEGTELTEFEAYELRKEDVRWFLFVA